MKYQHVNLNIKIKPLAGIPSVKNDISRKICTMWET